MATTLCLCVLLTSCGPPEIEGMVYVEGGTFTMGCTSEQSGCGDDETPTHEVTLSSFYIGKYEVTQGEYESVMGSNDSKNVISEMLPVNRIRFYQIVEYCNALSIANGLDPCYNINENNFDEDMQYLGECDFTKNGYRLPTEAEWEFAARGGNQSQGYKYSGSNDINEVAWHNGNSNNCTHEVGTKKSNELGIYDMSGNVWEFCWDLYRTDFYNNSTSTNPAGPVEGAQRSVRGGSWNTNARNCRVTNRDEGCRQYYRVWICPDGGDKGTGFRLVRTY